MLMAVQLQWNHLFPDREVQCIRIKIPCRDGRTMPSLVVLQKNRQGDLGKSPLQDSQRNLHKNAPGILWIHGGLCAAVCMMARDRRIT
jgi:hypothetical protein